MPCLENIEPVVRENALLMHSQGGHEHEDEQQDDSDA